MVVKDHIDQSENLEYEDRLEIVVPEQPGVDPIPPSIMKKLKIEHPLGREFASLQGASGIFTDLDNQKKHYLMKFLICSKMFRNMIPTPDPTFGVGSI